MLLLLLVVVGFGFMASRSAAPPPQEKLGADVAAARQAIDGLLAPESGADVLGTLPADFTTVTGVTPAREMAPDGTLRAIHVGGGCSTPWGDDNTRWDYGTSCRAHDLGYDLLRYAAAKGQPLGQDARKALDDRLSADMHAMCGIKPAGSADLCGVVASLYSAGLVVNSWHQRWGPPIGEPIGPMLAGVGAIGLLLPFRLRWWLRRRHAVRRSAERGSAGTVPRHGSRWGMLGVAGVVALVLGEAGIALARWTGASEDWLWPVSWLAQLAFVFFFAGGHANAAGWRAVLDAGGGYREYLAHRAGRLLRPALIFAVVAFAVPLALELLAIPPGTGSAVMRIALHPLWLLGAYLVTIVLAPALLALHRRGPWVVLLAVLGVVPLLDLAAQRTGSPRLADLAAVGLALLAQQLAFLHLDGRAPRRLLLGLGSVSAGTLVVATALGAWPPLLLGVPGTPPALAGPIVPALLLGLAHLGLLALLARPLAVLARRPALAGAAGFALRAPMSLYLAFLSAILVLVSAVYLPERVSVGPAWLAQPRLLMALALLAGPAALVFWWFERHVSGPPLPALAPRYPHDRMGAVLSKAAAGLGVGYAMFGVFGFARTSFAGDAGRVDLLGVPVDPIQSLVLLLLGVCMLDTLRTGTSAAPGTWLVSALACVPLLLSATTSAAGSSIGLVIHGGTAVFAAVAATATLLVPRLTGRESGITRH
ncbi:phospholipase A2 [Amycolatopsis cihanbeyliensis]